MISQIKNLIEQIKCGEVPEGYKKTKVGIVPAEWKEVQLCLLSSHNTRKNTDGKVQITLTNSATQGVIKQTDYFDKRISNIENITGYYVVQEDDYIYNPRISVSAPCGPINKSHFSENGVVSPLYTVFRMNNDLKKNRYIEFYFKSSFWHRYICGVANYGARHDRMNVTNDDLFSMPVIFPPLAEQQKIAEILSTQDKLIELKEKRIEAKKRQKKYLMQQFLTGQKRLHGFSNEWINMQLGDVFVERVETNCQDLELLSITGTRGVISRSKIEIKDNSSEDKSKYLKICKGDIGYNTMRMWQGVSALSKFEGIVSPAYTILIPSKKISAKYFSYLFKMHHVIFLFYRFSQGIVDDTRSLKYHEFAKLHLYVPSDKKEQTAIAELLDTIDKEIDLLQKDLDQEKQKKKALMQLLLTGIVRVNI